MKRINQSVVDDAVERLKREFQPMAIYHFGSSSRGNVGPDSDIDLLVVIKRSDKSFVARAADAYRALRGLGSPVDVLVYTEDEFRPRAALPVSFERTVVETGRLMHAA